MFHVECLQQAEAELLRHLLDRPVLLDDLLETAECAVQLQPAGEVSAVNVVLAGMALARLTPAAALGPLLVTVRV